VRFLSETGGGHEHVSTAYIARRCSSCTINHGAGSVAYNVTRTWLRSSTMRAAGCCVLRTSITFHAAFYRLRTALWYL